MTQEILDEEKEDFEDAIFALTALMGDIGHKWTPNYPYFAKGDWTNGGVYDGEKLMGAAMNINMLMHEPGAYVHNRYYAKRLIFDMIDYAYDAQLQPFSPVVIGTTTYYDGSDVAQAISHAVGLEYVDHDGNTQVYTQKQADKAAAYLDFTSTISGIQRR